MIKNLAQWRLRRVIRAYLREHHPWLKSWDVTQLVRNMERRVDEMAIEFLAIAETQAQIDERNMVLKHLRREIDD